MSTNKKQRRVSLWPRMGAVAAITVLSLSMSACTKSEPENGAQPTPMATETFGSDYATATPTPSGAAAPTSPSSSRSATPTLPSEAVNSSLLPSSVSEAEVSEMKKVTTDFIKAYGSIDKTDEKPTQWRGRAAAYTTPQYQKELEKTYPDGARMSGWDDFKKNHSRQFAEISSVRVGVGKDYASGKVTMSAGYLLSVTSDVSNGTQVLGRQNKFVELTKVNDAWKVSGIHNISGGGA